MRPAAQRPSGPPPRLPAAPAAPPPPRKTKPTPASASAPKAPAGASPAASKPPRGSVPKRAPPQARADAAVGEAEIGDIFETLKREKKKRRVEGAKVADAGALRKKEAKPPKKRAEEADDKRPKPVRFTEEGYRIYTLEELNVGKGGDTPLCPFDCNCCF